MVKMNKATWLLVVALAVVAICVRFPIREFQRVQRFQIRVEKLILSVKEQLEIARAGHFEMIVALRTDHPLLFQFSAVYCFRATRAFNPLSIRDLITRANGRFYSG